MIKYFYILKKKLMIIFTLIFTKIIFYKLIIFSNDLLDFLLI